MPPPDRVGADPPERRSGAPTEAPRPKSAAYQSADRHQRLQGTPAVRQCDCAEARAWREFHRRRGLLWPRHKNTLEARRAAALTPRPADYRGGPVRWERAS